MRDERNKPVLVTADKTNYERLMFLIWFIVLT